MAKFDATRVQVQRQLQGMGCERYEIGVRSEKGMLIKTWTARGISTALGWLKHQNANGADIYVRPARDEDAALVLVDDLTRDAVSRLKSDGLMPAVVVETSVGNFQAWIRLARCGQRLDAGTRARVARHLAIRYGGDPASADHMHFGRLAGFTNRKPQHACDGTFRYVIMHSYAGRVAEKASAVLAEALGGEELDLEASLEASGGEELDLEASLEASVEELLEWYNGEWERLRERYMDMKKWDANRADYLLAGRLLADGYDVLTVAQVMLRHAAIERKHDCVDYVARTVCKAKIGALEKARPCMERLKKLLKNFGKAVA